MYKLEEMLSRIKEVKKQQGYTNKTLAAKIDVAVGTLGKILSGETKDPQISTIIKIAECFNVSADYFLFGEEKSSTSENTEADDFNLEEKEIVYAYRDASLQNKNITRMALSLPALEQKEGKSYQKKMA